LWLWEDCFFESGVATATAALAWTERLRVGVSLLPVPLRNVALTSMEAATLHRMFPDRAILAVGHGVQSWMAQTGSRVESPLTLLREYLHAMRALLRGERVTTNGRYVRLDDVALEWPPPTAPPVFAGGIGPRTVELCGEAADGTVLDVITTPDSLRESRELINQGRAKAARTDPHPIVVYLHTATGEGAAERLQGELKRRGQSPNLGVTGNAETVAAAVRALAEAGADTVVLEPTADEPDIEGFIRFAAKEVRLLLTP